jgi:uncharacterized protein YlxP (DUF503 family)
VHVASLTVELRIRDVRSLKQKRATLRPILEGARRRFAVACAEVDHQDLWQRSTLGMACVSASAGKAHQVLDAVERWVWSFPEVEVTSVRRSWMSDDDG